MPLWSHDSPPIFFPSAGLTKSGWINPDTGEVLVTLNDSENQIGPGTDLRRHSFGTARIQSQKLRLQTGNSAVRVTTQKTQDGSSRLQVIHVETRTGTTRIQATTTKTAFGLGAIQKTEVRTGVGNSAIRKTQLETMEGTSKVIYRLSNLSNLIVEYPFYQSNDQLMVRDYSTNQNHATLSGNAVWNNLGLRLNGTQSISIPNNALVPSNRDFTVFIVAQSEQVTENPGYLVRWGAESGIRQAFDIYLNEEDKLAVDLQGDGWKGKFEPTLSVPFAMVSRYDAEGRQIDTRIADNSENATCVGVYDYFNLGTTHFLTENGRVGDGFRGTLIYMAIFDRRLSNGEVSHLLDFAYMTLLVRGPNLPESEEPQ